VLVLGPGGGTGPAEGSPPSALSQRRKGGGGQSRVDGGRPVAAAEVVQDHRLAALGREQQPGVEPGRQLVDLRATFASDALATGVSVFELARLMGTSVLMIERAYGTLLDGAGADIARRLDALDAERARARGAQ
jgi:hypothetical protein